MIAFIWFIFMLGVLFIWLRWINGKDVMRLTKRQLNVSAFIVATVGVVTAVAGIAVNIAVNTSIGR